MPLSRSGSFTDHHHDNENNKVDKGDDIECQDSFDLDRLEITSVSDDDNSSTTSGSNSNNSSSKGGSSRHASGVLGLERKDDDAIKLARILFFLVLMLAAGIIGYIIYRSARNNQVEDFETKFQTNAKELFVGSQESVRKSIVGLKSLSTTMTMFMNYDNDNHREQSHPPSPGFVTLPNVQEQFESIRNVTGALIIAYMPLISVSTNDDLEKWNNYSFTNQDWISKSNGGVETTKPILPKVWNYGPPPDDDDDDRRRRFLLQEGGNTCGAVHDRRRHLSSEEEEDDPRVPVTVETNNNNDNNNDSTTSFFVSPVWTMNPPPKPDDTDIINFDLLEKPVFKKAVDFIQHTRNAVFLDVCNQAKWFGNTDHADELQTVIAYPVFDSFNNNNNNNEGEESSKIVGHLTAIIPWVSFFDDILHHHDMDNDDSGEEGKEEGGGDMHIPITIVLENTCDEEFTLEITSDDAVVLNADEDIHDTHYDYLKMSEPFAEFTNPQDQLGGEHCVYTISAYPTAEFEDNYLTHEPGLQTLLVLAVILSTATFFLIFDWLVSRRQVTIVNVAMKQNAIVSSLFPKNIQAKMMEEVGDNNNGRNNEQLSSRYGKAGIKSFLKDNTDNNSSNQQQQQPTGGKMMDKSKPIADLFPQTTIMFADIAGFTAWSSTREPSQVFTLLESVYAYFDTIARRRKVFKVETIGDCYVAVCGLPDPRKDHAICMAKFSHECLQGMGDVIRQLEVELGPSTSDLSLRVGLHSGPVVAGVLRGEKSRFQLFGDTMNTASRMESTGVASRIQISHDTADLLVAAGRSKWLVPREDQVEAKGKGFLKTFWLNIGTTNSNRTSSSTAGLYSDTASCSGRSSNDGDSTFSEEYNPSFHNYCDNQYEVRLSNWTSEVLAGLLKEIVARRQANDIVDSNKRKNNKKKVNKANDKTSVIWEKKLLLNKWKNDSTVIDEVEEVIELPKFNAAIAKKEKELLDEVELSEDVYGELSSYVQKICSMYNRNPFHNFLHANHVTGSVIKLLSRIVADPDIGDINNKSLHDHTYGITSDPLTRFTVVLSALIHDVDHQGVSNVQLCKERTEASILYKNKSVAEQNSVDLAWNLLMEPSYKNLRKQIYSTEEEFERFRQLLVNTVMATDIMDKDLKKLRNDRWDKAFSIPPDEEKVDPRAVNRKATIVIEHVIQASDVSHTMQHWRIYRKWNERLFEEMYKAYEEGRSDTDPSTNWYKGELGFFDFYIIPLAKKLFDCKVFGPNSDECLNYAKSNRAEWELRGEGIVKEMVENIKRKKVGDIVYSIQRDCVDPEGEKMIVKGMLSFNKNGKIISSSSLSKDDNTSEGTVLDESGSGSD